MFLSSLKLKYIIPKNLFITVGNVCAYNFL